jgi:hypothetical protein
MAPTSGAIQMLLLMAFRDAYQFVTRQRQPVR